MSRKLLQFIGLLAAVFALIAVLSPAANVVYAAPASLSSPYTQNFNSLINTGTGNTWTNDSTLPGWYATRTTYNAGDGASNTGALYSFGSTSSTERALGSVGSSGTGTIVYGVTLINDTSGPINQISVDYTGEQWRNGGNTTPHTLEFSYQVNAANLTSGTWADFDDLDFTGPIATASAGALDGNAGANRVSLSDSFSVALNPGDVLWLRWLDIDNSGADHGLAIDDLTITASLVDFPPFVTTTTPENNALDVALDTNVVINFSENVNIVGTIDFECDLPITFTTSSTTNVSSITLTPDTDLPSGETCTVTLDATDVEDLDDTPDTMTDPFTLTFTTYVPLVCGAAPDFIYELQENGAKFGLGGTFTVDGVVTGDFQNNNQLNGYFIQDPDGDGDATTSDGIFVYDPAPFLLDVEVGQYVRVSGTVSEFKFLVNPDDTSPDGETQLTATSVTLCANTATVTPTMVTLPFATFGEQENYEGMLVTFPQTLTVTEMFTLGRYNEVSVSVGGRLFNPTNVVAPGAAAVAMQELNNRSRILVDDGSKFQNLDPIVYPAPELTAVNTLRHGDTTTGLVGIFTQSNSRSSNGTATNPNPFRYRFHPTTIVGWDHDNERPPTPPTVGGTVKVASFNLLNYFNTFTGCFNGCRGANNSTEFARQRTKTIAAIIGLDVDVLGVNELENDAPGGSAIEDLVDGLNEATAPGTYDFINTGQVGTDAIRVAVIYKPANVTPVGDTAILDNVDPFNRNTRPPVAQSFRDNSNNAVFTIVVNHFKSKGSCPTGDNFNPDNNLPNHDTGDGQGCWNGDRVAAASKIISWLATDPTDVNDPDVLIIGDLNGYAQEDPITYLTDTAGYTNLIEQYVGAGDVAYSYVFDGQSGYLDHGLASPSIVSQVTGAGEWHINADEPAVLDYNMEFKSANQLISLYAPDQYRTSDHDPLIIGLNLDDPVTPTETPTDEPTATATDTATDEPTATATDTATDEPTATATDTATDEPTATETPTTVELLRNPGFEDQSPVNANQADQWNFKRVVKDRRKCNNPDTGKIFSRTGDCAYMFTGSDTEKSHIIQGNPDIVLPDGITLNASVYYRTNAATPRINVRLKVFYADAILPVVTKAQINLVSQGIYTLFALEPYTLDTGRPLTNIKLQFQNRAKSGKIFLDDASLNHVAP